MSIEREKQAAAEAAADLVEDGMTVGLGTGSTVAFLLPALARRSPASRSAAVRTASRSPGKRASMSPRRSEMCRCVPSARVCVKPASRSTLK